MPLQEGMNADIPRQEDITLQEDLYRYICIHTLLS